MKRDEDTVPRNDPQEDDRGGILDRIEEKLERLLGRSGYDWHDRGWAPEDSPFAYYSPRDPSPRLFGGPRADAPGWDPSIAGPRFDRINVGAVGTHGIDPVSSFDGAQAPLIGAHSSAREYYLLRRAMARSDDANSFYADYRDRQMHDLDREYADYRREQQSRFDRDFDAWRQKRPRPPKPVDEPSRGEVGTEDGEEPVNT
jgi:hypothetical protein